MTKTAFKTGLNSKHEQLKLECIDLPSGMSRRMICPACLGGSSNERSLSVTRAADDNLLYNCYRASCSFSGGVDSRGDTEKPSRTADPTNRFTGSTINITDQAKMFLEREYRLKPFMYSGWLETFNRSLLIPYKDINGTVWGHVDRNFPEYSGIHRTPKAINHIDIAGAHTIHFPHPPETDTLYLVEDILSAERVGEVKDCCALLGTHMSEEVAIYLARNRIRNLVWLFDSDANGKAIKESSKHEILFDTSRVITRMLSDPDPKDQDDVGLRRIVNYV